MAMFGQNRTKCVVCSTEIDSKANFCPACGAAQPAGETRCGSCGKTAPGGVAFCPHCGHKLSTAASPNMDRENRWQKEAEAFATRVEVRDLSGILHRHLIVEPGTRAIILVDGVNQGTLPPGKYVFEDIGKKLGKAFNLGTAQVLTAILIDDGPVELSFDVPGVFTNDPLQMEFACRLVVKLDPAGDAPLRFLKSMLKSSRSFTLADLRSHLFLEIQAAANDWMSGHSVRELNKGVQLKHDLENYLEMTLNQTFQRVGLLFEALRTMNFAHEGYDEVQQTRARYFLEVERLEALQQGEVAERMKELESRKLLFDMRNEAELQQIFEETEAVKNYEQRAQLWSRMRRAVNSDKMDEVRTQEELEAFLHEIDKNHLIRANEYEELKRTFAEAAQDHDLERAFLGRKLEMQRQLELDRMELAGLAELTEARLKVREMQLQAQLQEERTRRLQQKQIQAEERQIEINIALETAKTKAQIEALEHEQDRLDLELAHYAMELLDARKSKKQWDEMRLEAEREELALQRRLREEAQRHQQEMERLQLLSTASVELLISVSGTQQAGMLAELKRTETLSGMSEEQILAMAAEKSPEVAKAFQEKLRGLSVEEMKTMYERMVGDKDAAADRLAEALREGARMQQETAFKAMETQRDISVAYAQSGGHSTPVIVTPGGGMVTPEVSGQGTGGQRVIVCPRCQAEWEAGVQYCANCGYQFYERT
jgi:hypothetical protein